MPYPKVCCSNLDEETLQDLQELEGLVPHIPAHMGDPEFRKFICELIEEIQDLCAYSSHAKMLRNLIAHFGEAYFFYNKTGDFCFMTDFLTEIRSAEKSLTSV